MGEQINTSISEAITSSIGVNRLPYFNKNQFNKLKLLRANKFVKATLFADMCRFNCLYMISRAGSGHIGSSFSSMDIITWLYLNILTENDIYFSSKGHDSPGLYSVQTALGIVPFNKLHSLRRINGLPGHPDVNTPGSYTNTGSLGMGVSKAKGFLFAKKAAENGDIFVLTGDGELQEGQFWESLISFSSQPTNRITIIIDNNKLQSDTYVEKVSSLGNLKAKIESFNCRAVEIDGHNFHEIDEVFKARKNDNTPLVIIANTIKGKGVTFMEHTNMIQTQEYYRYHSGAPTLEEFKTAASEISSRIERLCKSRKLTSFNTTHKAIDPTSLSKNIDKMIPAYSDALKESIKSNQKIVALDADLVLDTGLIPIKEGFKDNFIECGIAEQDMVSRAGTMALCGLIPVVHSFACFLTSRASEQIYNNQTQKSKVIYVGSLAGILPAGPGHSHQAVRDYTAMMGMHDLLIYEPIHSSQIKKFLSWAISKNDKSVYLRLTSIPYEFKNEMEVKNKPSLGKGHILSKGNQFAMISYGPICSKIALDVSDRLLKSGIRLTVIAMPWINKVNISWFKKNLKGTKQIFTFENHLKEAGAGSYFISSLSSESEFLGTKFFKIGLDNIPYCGRNDEVMKAHKLDASSVEKFILKAIKTN